MSIVIVGHVDHGTSTIIGRLLVDSHSLPDGKLEQMQELRARTPKPFEYAPDAESSTDALDHVVRRLQDQRIVFRPW